MVGIVGFEGNAINVWLIWILPFVGASIIPAIAKAGNRVRNYIAVAFCVGECKLLCPFCHWDYLAPQSIVRNWISIANLQAGVLADPFVHTYDKSCSLDLFSDIRLFHWLYAW